MTPAPALTARELLCPNWRRVEALERYRDVALAAAAPVYAVFAEDGALLGLVEARQAALFPDRVFADLLVRRPVKPLAPDDPVEAVLARLEGERLDHLPVLDADGGLIGIVSRLSLFTALTERERALREEREQLIAQLGCELEHREVAASVFDGLVEGIMVIDAQLRILLVNPAFTQTTGFSAQEAIGQTPRLLQSGQHDRAFYHAMWSALERQGYWEGEIWNRRKNGEIYPEWLRIQAVKDAAGAVRYYVGIFSDISQHVEMRAKLLHLAYYDMLTGLPNRQLLLDRMNHAIAHGRRAHKGFALLYLDLDRFKDLNDTRGHRFGDQVLTTVGQRLSGTLRSADTVARLGGDEFVILLADTADETAIAETAQKVLDLLNAPMHIGVERVHVGASIGIARFPADGSDADTLLMKADSALYRAKADGRGLYHFHSDQIHDELRQRFRLIESLRQAIDQNELWLAWQPQVRLADGRIVGAEALVRWTQDDGTPVTPAQFVPLAEEAGLIEALGGWVIEAVMRAGSRLVEASPLPLRLGVNLSPLQIKANSHARLVERLTQGPVPPHHLMIELTESALSTHRAGCLPLLEALTAVGVLVAVDDFGTGCSNLAMLKTLPLRQLKIDRSFIADLLQDVNDRMIVKAMIDMAHALAIEVLAEGVETLEQAALLRELSCDLAQGYLYGRPMTLEPILELLRQGRV